MMIHASKPIQVTLKKPLTRAIKRGHAWLYSQAIELPKAPSGSTALLKDRSGKTVASGIFDPRHAIPLRICRVSPPFELDDAWFEARLRQAIELRSLAFGPETTGYRLVAGEGDRLPGLIIDVYQQVAVIKLDGGAPEAFYHLPAIAQWLAKHTSITTVIRRSRRRGRGGELLLGNLESAEVEFLENSLRFTADVLQGQKTGFFLDQRDNRDLVRRISRRHRVLNLFSFNGGFSVAAGVGGASEVTSVDIAAPAIDAAQRHWQLNDLSIPHHGLATDCFEFLESAVSQPASGRQRWSLVICDPPSFAPNEKVRERALAAYAKLAYLSAQVTSPDGFLGLASCSSHVDSHAFLQANLEGIGRARRQATLVSERGLPIDHPTPMAMPELRYLKFQLLRLGAG